MSAHAVSFSDEAGPSSPRSGIPSSPSKIGRSNIGGARDGIVPLGAAKTVAALTTRRGVIFSPANETRTFDLNDSILPLKDAPPPSIRSYALSDPICFSSPIPSSSRCGTPVSVRSILKTRASRIRVAASVEEGTLRNKEPARLLVSGQRPRLLARDSFQLATMRTAAADGVTTDKGKGKAIAGSDDAFPSDEAPGSDDSAASEDVPPGGSAHEGSSEMEEEIEEPGSLAPTSLIGIILDGAEDLLTLEEAYAVLNANLRTRIPTNIPPAEWPAVVREELQLAVAPIRDEAPAMVRAMQRDLQRVLGKVPGIEAGSSTRESSPFRGLMPLRDTTRSRLTPSPTPVPSSKRLDSSGAKKGYTEAEVRYRREAAGVGAATLRFIALVMHIPALYGCFSETDMTSLLDLVLSILRTPSLPTPNPKRTYYTALTVLGGLKISPASVVPLREKIARALESALTDGLGLGQGSPTAKDSSGQIKKESHIAAVNLFSTYPTIFLSHHAEFLPTALRGLHSALPLTRMRSSALLAALTTAKLNALTDTADRETWTRNKVAAQKMELFVVSHLRSVVRSKAAPVYTATGEKKTEWNELERVFKETVGNANDVAWACATWSTVVCLMGSAYASSGLASSFDHIMDRSLQPSTNVVRPLLARVAWSHAIYAYLSAGWTVSLSDDGKLVTSYKPFPSSAAGDHTERIKTLQMPVDLALSLALDPQNYTRVEKDGRWAWQRVEKAKKFQWLNTCGLGAAAVVYAYSGTALYHQDQPAKEMMALSGLPSSDGAAVPDSAREEAMLERLDRAWDRVVRPLLKSLGAVCAVDRVKVHGWGILDAILSQSAGQSTAEVWSLDRLVSAKYINGDIFTLDKADKEDSIDALLETVDMEAIRPNEIPAWGSGWIVRRIDSVLALFEDLLTGIGGLAEPDLLRWTGPDSVRFVPASFSRMWTNILRAVAAHPTNTPEYTTALTLITRHLLQVFNRDPTTHVPVSSLRIDNTTVADADTLRLGLFSHLLHLTLEVLGPDVLGASRMRLGPGADKVDTVIFNTSFGSTGTEGAKEATMAGCLLGQLLRAQVLSFPLQPAAMASFKLVLETVVMAGAAPGHSAKLLGDLTNAMPFIFHDQEEVQLVVWRVLASQWVTFLDAQMQTQTTTSSSTNHTGALLVSLLSCPFRDRAVTSAWHHKADLEDLRIWQSLMAATVQRFRARQVGPNFGVLESLAGHLCDFLESNDKTSSTTITLSCLASAMGHMRFADAPMGRHDDHYGVNESYVPRDFLAVVSAALLESYPRPESLTAGSQGGGEDVRSTGTSPAVFDLLKAIREVLSAMPVGVAGEVVGELKDALAVWMRDDLRLVRDQTDAEVLDELYVALMAALGGAIQSALVPATAQTMDDLIDLFAPRLNRGTSAAVPAAFKTFYEGSFAGVRADEMSERVRDFVEEVLAAVPGMIDVPGLHVQDTFSQSPAYEQEDSQARFPHALGLVPASEDFVPELEEPAAGAILVDSSTALDATQLKEVSANRTDDTDPAVADVAMDQQVVQDTTISAEYDADVSQTQSQVVIAPAPKRSARARRASSKAAAALTPIASEAELGLPVASEAAPSATDAVIVAADASANVDNVAAPEDFEDVFGPTSRRIAKAKKGRGKGKKRASSSRPSGDSESLPVPKRSKTASPPAEAEMSHSLPLPALFTPSASSSTRSAAQDIEEEDEEDCISVYQSPPHPPPTQAISAPKVPKVPKGATQRSKARAQSRARSSAPREVIDMSQTPESDHEQESAAVSPETSQSQSLLAPHSQPNQNDLHPRPSLLTSAKGWLARVPSLFSPTTVMQPTHSASNADAEPIDTDGAETKADHAAVEVAEQLQVDVESALSNLKTVKPRKEGWDEEKRRWVDKSGMVMTPGLLARLKARHASKDATPEEKELYRRWKGYDLEPRPLRRTESVSGSARSTPSQETPEQSVHKSNSQSQALAQDVDSSQSQGQGSTGRRQKKRKGRKGAGPADATTADAPVRPLKREPELEATAKPAPTSSKRKAAAVVEVFEDDEDELLLSPESARKRRKEEEGDIAAAVERGASQPASPAALRTRSRQKQPDQADMVLDNPVADTTTTAAKALRQGRAKRASQASLPSIASELSQAAQDLHMEPESAASGQFEDAEESQRSLRRQAAAADEPPAIPPTPVHRTAQQTRLLKLLEDASKAEQAVNNLDAAGVWEMLRNIDTLREAAQRNLKGKWEAERVARRARGQ